MRPIAMNHISIFCILFGAWIPSILAYRCLRYPVGYLESGCSVKNLTVFDGHLNPITDDRYCDGTVNVPLHNLDWGYHINFTSILGPQYQGSTFLLVVLDNTAKQLLWMISNITVPVYDRRLTPLGGHYNRPITLKPYEKPTFDAAHREHQIEFLVFEQRNPMFHMRLNNVQQSYYPFNLLQWLDVQIASGAVLCGPVAGAVVRIYVTSNYVPLYPSSTYPPVYPPNNHNHHQGGNLYPTLDPLSPHHSSHNRNAAFRFGSNSSLLCAIIGAVLYWLLRS